MKLMGRALFFVLTLASTGLAADKIEPPDNCKYCGMNRTQFAHSRMLITYADGIVGTCSINCTVIDRIDNRDKRPQSLQVGDYATKKLIDARSAVWVIGGKKRGVMTPVAKWAFTDQKAALTYIKEHGGNLATFGDAFKATEQELKEE